jgi:hypothetical protein
VTGSISSASAGARNANVRDLHALRVAKVRHDRPGGRDRGHRGVEAVAGQRRRFQLLAQHLARAGRLERPAFHARDTRRCQRRQQGADVDIGRRKQFFRPKHGQFGRQRIGGAGAVELRGREFARRQIEEGKAPRHCRRGRRRDGGQKGWFPRFQIRGIGDCAG